MEDADIRHASKNEQSECDIEREMAGCSLHCPDESNMEEDEDIIDEIALKDAEVDLQPEELQERHNTALQYKHDGNSLFQKKDYTEARAKYTAALRLCPLSCSKDRSILYANRAACSRKEGRLKEAIDDCTCALELDANYVKALKRRAEAYEAHDKFDESLEDYKKILEMQPNDQDAVAAVQRLPPMISERNEKLKGEMLDQFKNLANKLLQPFGLSTNNFQLQQNANDEGYSVNFVNN